MSERIYALYYETAAGRQYFYVGRTERAGDVRYREHRAAVISDAPRFQTDVYRFIRDEVFCAVFEEEILCECTENPDDHEDYYVVKLIREGYVLRNMKHGDAKRMAATALANSSEVIRSVKDVRAYKERVAGEAAAKLRASIGRGFPAHLTKAIAAASEMATANRLAKAKKADMRGVSRKIADAEHDSWLNKMSGLFEAGEIDGLGNRLISPKE